MRGRLAAATLLAAVLLLLAVSLQMMKTSSSAQAPAPKNVTTSTRGLTIIVTFSNLVYDVKPILCSSDSVEAIVPPGVDPHSYQLTPSDLEKIRKADLVISTGHAPFEVKLRSLVPRDKLVEIPRIEGIKLLSNPDTGQPNYHMPIYEPHNYITFIDYVAHRLAELRPSCANHYLSAAKDIENRVEELIEKAPKLNLSAVGSTPPVQYPVEWLGIHVKLLLSPEEGVPPTPEILERARSLLSRGSIAVVMVRGNEPATLLDARLESMARQLGAPVLRVPAPFLPGSIPSKLQLVVKEVSRLAHEEGR